MATEDPRNEESFRWKHHDNASGPSPAGWLCTTGRVVGYRTYLRWRFLDDAGKQVRAVRAVDTATDPAYQGMGIFRTLALRSVAELTLAGDAIVFNTPNDQSRPGYLKMGWSVARRLPVGVLPVGPARSRRWFRRVCRRTCGRNARMPVWMPRRRWPIPLSPLPFCSTRHLSVRTDRTPDFLAWRTSSSPLAYRVLLASDGDPSEGGLIFRLRRRGPAVEAAIIEQLVPT